MATVTDGDKVVVKVALPQGGELRVDGLVVKVDPGFGFALRFPELTTDQRKKIRVAVQDVPASEGSFTVQITDAVPISAVGDIGYAL